MSDFAENLRKALFDKHLKAIDIARGTNITPSVISRYLSGTNQPSRDNLFAVANYLGVSSEWLLSSPDAPVSPQGARAISSDKDKIIAVQNELIERLKKDVGRLEEHVKEWEDWKASSKDRHAKGREKTKNPTKPKKQKVGFMRKRKKS